MALPIEIPTDQYAELVRSYCYEQFVSKGMCCDFAVHDKGDGNPHTYYADNASNRRKWKVASEVQKGL